YASGSFVHLHRDHDRTYAASAIIVTDDVAGGAVLLVRPAIPHEVVIGILELHLGRNPDRGQHGGDIALIVHALIGRVVFHPASAELGHDLVSARLAVLLHAAGPQSDPLVTYTKGHYYVPRYLLSQLLMMNMLLLPWELSMA